MDDFGQLIAIIVGVIFLVINGLGKKKKPVAPPYDHKTPTPNVPRTKTGIPELDMFLEEISGQSEKKEEIKPVSSSKYDTLETIEPNSPYAEYNSVDYFEEIQQDTNHIKLGDEKKQILKDNSGTFEDSNCIELSNKREFNLRDAIIFSEILKRPSY